MRVNNEDRVIPGDGFRSHSHRDMEIILYVLKGALEQKERVRRFGNALRRRGRLGKRGRDWPVRSKIRYCTVRGYVND